MVLFRVLAAVLLNSLLPRVKEQLIKYLKNEFVGTTKEVGTLSTKLTCEAVKEAIFIPCSPAICGFVIMTKRFFRDLICSRRPNLLRQLLMIDTRNL